MSSAFLKRAWNETITPTGWFYRGAANVFVALPASVVVLLWPWLTFLTLMIFLASMRRASVRPAHVMRCAVYVSDAIWLVPILVVLAPGELMFLGHYNYAVDGSSLTLINVTVCFAAVATCRLAAAYRLYLNPPRHRRGARLPAHPRNDCHRVRAECRPLLAFLV